jgi:hypothetical protein
VSIGISVVEARRQFGNPEEEERLPFTRKLVKIVTEDTS